MYQALPRLHGEAGSGFRLRMQRRLKTLLIRGHSGRTRSKIGGWSKMTTKPSIQALQDELGKIKAQHLQLRIMVIDLGRQCANYQKKILDLAPPRIEARTR
jgi:hypothetical protein